MNTREQSLFQFVEMVGNNNNHDGGNGAISTIGRGPHAGYNYERELDMSAILLKACQL
jgi:hypothetical protein